jgi:hypothetical protein
MAASVVADSHHLLSFIDGVISDALQYYSASVVADCEVLHTGQTISANIGAAAATGLSWCENWAERLHRKPSEIRRVLA